MFSHGSKTGILLCILLFMELETELLMELAQQEPIKNK